MKNRYLSWTLALLLISAFSAYAQLVTQVDDFNRASLGSNWSADAAYQISSNALDNTSTEAGWNFYGIYLPIINATEVSFKWATTGDVEGANSGGAIVMFDRTLLTGYFILRRFGNLDLHPIIGGIIKRDIVVASVTPALSNPKPGDIMKVAIAKLSGGHQFTLYINGAQDGRLTDTAKLYGNGSTLHVGVALYGQRNNNIDDYTVKGYEPAVPIPSITVTSPNGGESWYVNSSHNITWSSANFSGNVKIDLSINGGSTWSTVAASVANSGSYTWTVPNSPATTCKIRVADATDSDPTDMSNSNFTIAPEPVELRVTSPNGGESWYAGSVQTITWTATVYSGTVKIELSLDGGLTYSTVTASTTNNGSYIWNLTTSTSTACRIRISDTADGDPVDISNADFTIAPPPPTLQLTKPNGGESWLIGTQQEIRWTGPGAVDIPLIRIYYSVDDGVSWTLITSSASNSGLFLWTVPNQPTPTARIRIEDAADAVPQDMSDNAFAISALVNLQAKDGSGQPGSANAKLYIWMDNLTNVRGLSFRVNDSDNNLTAMDVLPVGRASGFTITEVDNGTYLTVFLVHMSGGVIPVGSGAIVQISYNVSAGATIPGYSDIILTDVTVADANSDLVVPTLMPGKFYYVLKGDIDGSGAVTSLDIDRGVDILLKRGAAMTPPELLSGDMDADGDFDLFDLMAIFDIVY